MSKVPVASDAKFADVSVPYCFICLLHLCNEKSLKLVRGCSFAVSHLLVQFNLSFAGGKRLVHAAQDFTRLIHEARAFIEHAFPPYYY